MIKLNKVLKYLQDHGSASKKEIRANTFYDNVGDGIMKLRNRGHNIVTTWDVSSAGARYAVYNYLGKIK